MIEGLYHHWHFYSIEKKNRAFYIYFANPAAYVPCGMCILRIILVDKVVALRGRDEEHDILLVPGLDSVAAAAERFRSKDKIGTGDFYARSEAPRRFGRGF